MYASFDHRRLSGQIAKAVPKQELMSLDKEIYDGLGNSSGSFPVPHVVQICRARTRMRCMVDLWRVVVKTVE